jgi:hypothetical protein
MRRPSLVISIHGHHVFPSSPREKGHFLSRPLGQPSGLKGGRIRSGPPRLLCCAVHRGCRGLVVRWTSRNDAHAFQESFERKWLIRNSVSEGPPDACRLPALTGMVTRQIFAMMKQAKRYREYLGLAARRRRLKLRHKDVIYPIRPRFRPAITQ